MATEAFGLYTIKKKTGYIDPISRTLVVTRERGNFDAAIKSKKMQGLDNLIQRVITFLFMEPKEWNGFKGADIMGLLAGNIGESSLITSAVMDAVEKIKREIKNEDQKNTNEMISRDSFLEDIIIKNFIADEEETKYFLSLVVQSITGKSIDFTSQINL